MSIFDVGEEYAFKLYFLPSYSVCVGPRVVLVGSTPLLFSQKPLLLYNGVLTCQTASGKTSEVALSTHSFLKHAPGTSSGSSPELSEQLTQALKLKRSEVMLQILFWFGCKGLIQIRFVYTAR